MDMDYFLITKMIYFFIPQLFYREIFLPFGIQSTQLHINYWDNKDFERFENFIIKHHNKIVNLDYIINIADPNPIQNIINFIVEKLLKLRDRLSNIFRIWHSNFIISSIYIMYLTGNTCS